MLALGMTIYLSSPFPEGHRLMWYRCSDCYLLIVYTIEEGRGKVQFRGSQKFGDAGRVLQPILLAHPSPCPEEVLLAQNGVSSLIEEINMWLLLQGCRPQLRELGLDVAEQGAGGYVLLPYSES